MSEEFSVDGARAAAARDDIAGWVRRFLASPGSDNAPLGESLAEELSWWAGPVLLPIGRMHRLAGPPGEPVLCPVHEGAWDERVEEIERHVEAGNDVPPVIVSARDHHLVLEDGNHRVEGLRQGGHRRAWALVGFTDRRDRDRFAREWASE